MTARITKGMPSFFIDSPRGDIRFGNHPVSRDALAIKICPFAGANQIRSSFHLNFNLSFGDCDAASIASPPDTETGAQILDVGGAHLHLQFVRTLVLDVEISVAAQQFNPWRLGIANGNSAVVIETDVDIRRRRHGQTLPWYRLMNPGRHGLCDEP